MLRWLMITLVCAACSGGTTSDEQEHQDMVTSSGNQDMATPATNPCPNGFFKIRANDTNSAAGVSLGGAQLGGGATGRQTPQAGDPWFANLTDTTYMDNFSMSPINLSARFTLARDEAARTLTVSGDASAAAASGVLVQSAGQMANATIELCDAAELLNQGKMFQLSYSCTGAGNGAHSARLTIQGSQVCTRNGGSGVWNISTGTFNIPAPAGHGTVAVSMAWDATAGMSGSTSAMVSPTFVLTIR